MKKTNKTILFYDILTVILFVWGAFALWETVYELCNMAGAAVSGTPSEAVKEAKRMTPLLLSTVCLTGLGVFCFNAFRFLDKGKRAKVWKNAGIWAIFWGVLIFGYTAAGLYTGNYVKLIEGFPTPLFPLDMVLWGIVFAAYGALALKYSNNTRYQRTADPINGRFRIFHIFVYAAALVSFAAVCQGLFTLDWRHGGVFFNLMLLANYALPVSMAAIYRFGFARQPSKKRRGFAKKYGMIFTAAGAVLTAGFLISVEMFNEAPCANAMGLLPIEFTASVNAFPLIYGPVNIISPLIALFWGMRTSKP